MDQYNSKFACDNPFTGRAADALAPAAAPAADALAPAAPRDTGVIGSRAVVAPDARVLGEAHVLDFAQVLDEAIVQQNAVITDNALVGGNALIEGHALLEDNARALEGSYVALGGHLGGDVTLMGQAHVFTGPFRGGVWMESPIQMVIGRFVVGVDRDGTVVGAPPDEALTRWERYLIGAFRTMVAEMDQHMPATVVPIEDARIVPRASLIPLDTEEGDAETDTQVDEEPTRLSRSPAARTPAARTPARILPMRAK